MTARFVSSVHRGRSSALVALAISVMVATTAHAAPIFTSNLSNITTPTGCTTCGPTGSNFQLNYNGGTVAGITNTSTGGVLGYNFVYSSPGSANLIGAYNDGGGSSIKLDSAVTADSADTQDHGYFLALDSVYQNSAIDIFFNTVAGGVYTVAFDYGGTQQVGFVGATTDFLSVALNGSQTQVTPSVNVAQQGFSGWNPITDTFTASSTGTATLSFLAGGTPSGAGQEPAMALLDNISISSTPPSTTPEPNSLILLSTGLIGLGGFVRSRCKKTVASNL